MINRDGLTRKKGMNHAEYGSKNHLLLRFTQGMDGLLGVAGMVIDDYGSFPKNPYV